MNGSTDKTTVTEAKTTQITDEYTDGLAQECSNSSASEKELLMSCAKPSICAPLAQIETNH